METNIIKYCVDQFVPNPGCLWVPLERMADWQNMAGCDWQLFCHMCPPVVERRIDDYVQSRFGQWGFTKHIGGVCADDSVPIQRS